MAFVPLIFSSLFIGTTGIWVWHLCGLSYSFGIAIYGMGTVVIVSPWVLWFIVCLPSLILRLSVITVQLTIHSLLVHFYDSKFPTTADAISRVQNVVLCNAFRVIHNRAVSGKHASFRHAVPKWIIRRCMQRNRCRSLVQGDVDAGCSDVESSPSELVLLCGLARPQRAEIEHRQYLMNSTAQNNAVHSSWKELASTQQATLDKLTYDWSDSSPFHSSPDVGCEGSVRNRVIDAQINALSKNVSRLSNVLVSQQSRLSELSRSLGDAVQQSVEKHCDSLKAKLSDLDVKVHSIRVGPADTLLETFQQKFDAKLGLFNETFNSK